MKAKLSAIGLGAFIACTCNAAFAGPTVTITQQGTGNTAYADQTTGINTTNSSATIIQVGANNHSGDPVALTAGIVQRNIDSSVARARIVQNGEENNASIVQDGARYEVLPDIQQTGDNNTGAITQNIVTYSDASLRQTGTNNVATLEQSHVADLSLLATQTGSDNRIWYRQYGSSYGNPSVTQTGSQNSATVDQENLIGTRGVQIEQVGDLNTVTSTQKDSDQPFDTVLQVGSGNTVATSQANGSGSSVIVQTGNFNLATVAQCMGANDALITQTGDNNGASASQRNPDRFSNRNTAYLTQIGSGFVASIAQAGSRNHAGLYQH